MNGHSLDSCLTLIADHRRRRLLEHLRHNGNGEIRVDDLIDQLYQAELAWTDGRQRGREALVTQLYHSHLPRLANHGVVEHNLERGTIEYRPNEQIETVLDGLPGEPSLANS